MPRVVHFEIHAGEPERAIQFYSKVFGWQCHKWDGPVPYWMISTGSSDEPGIDGGLIQRRGDIDGQAVIAYVCTVAVPSLDESIAKVEAAGGTIAVPKQAIPGIGWLAHAKDTEGNIFGMMQNDPNAQ